MTVVSFDISYPFLLFTHFLCMERILSRSFSLLGHVISEKIMTQRVSEAMDFAFTHRFFIRRVLSFISSLKR